MKRFLIPIAGEDHSDEILEFASILGKKFDAQIFILFVAQGSTYALAPGIVGPFPNVDKAIREAGHKLIDAAVRRMTSFGNAKIIGKMVTGDPVQKIHQFAAEHSIELIIMGTHGRRGIGRLLQGSVAEEVIRQSKIPIVVVPLKAAVAEAEKSFEEQEKKLDEALKESFPASDPPAF